MRPAIALWLALGGTIIGCNQPHCWKTEADSIGTVYWYTDKGILCAKSDTRTGRYFPTAVEKLDHWRHFESQQKALEFVEHYCPTGAK